MNKKITASIGVFLLSSILFGQTALGADGWQSGASEEKDVSTIQDGNEETYVTLAENLLGETALGYSLDENYTNEMIETHKKEKLPAISFVYKFTAVNSL